MRFINEEAVYHQIARFRYDLAYAQQPEEQKEITRKIDGLYQLLLEERMAYIKPPWQAFGDGEYGTNQWGTAKNEMPPPEETRSKGMNYSTAVFLVNEAIRAILCTYELDDEKKQAPRVMFKTLDKSIAVGDFLVVPTGTRHGMTVVKVMDVDVDVDFDSSTPVNWAVSKIDRSAYEAVLKLEGEAIEQIKAAEKKKRQTDLRDAMIANNPALATSFDSLKGDVVAIAGPVIDPAE
jgi:hypothetical protein